MRSQFPNKLQDIFAVSEARTFIRQSHLIVVTYIYIGVL